MIRSSEASGNCPLICCPYLFSLESMFLGKISAVRVLEYLILSISCPLMSAYLAKLWAHLLSLILLAWLGSHFCLISRGQSQADPGRVVAWSELKSLKDVHSSHLPLGQFCTKIGQCHVQWSAGEVCTVQSVWPVFHPAGWVNRKYQNTERPRNEIMKAVQNNVRRTGQIVRFVMRRYSGSGPEGSTGQGEGGQTC